LGYLHVDYVGLAGANGSSLAGRMLESVFFFLNERFIAQINIETYRIGTKLFRHTTNLQQWLNKYRYVCDSTKVTAVKTRRVLE
jgi:hypothetical protein